MEIKVIGKWTQQPNTEIYFDKVFRHYLVRNEFHIEIFPLFLSVSIVFKLEKALQEVFSQRFSQLRICEPRNLLSIVTENSQLV